jgi:hypothetical protein
MSDIRRENQAKRLAQQAENPRKPWIDGVVAVLSVASGLGAAYHLAKIEWAIPFGVVFLVCMTFLIGEIPWLRHGFGRGRRIGLQLAFVVMVVVASYSSVRAEYKKQHAALTLGILEPMSKPAATKPMLEIGDAGYMIDMSKVSTDEGIRFLQEERLKVEVQNGLTLISTIIRDKDDKVLVKVEKNHWEVAAPPLTMDKNYTKDTLEVKDARDRVVFKIRILPDHVQVEGEWRDDTGFGVRMAAPSRGMTRQGGMGISILRPRSEDPQGTGDALGRIEPIFQYPSSEHWGELIWK